MEQHKQKAESPQVQGKSYFFFSNLLPGNIQSQPYNVKVLEM